MRVALAGALFIEPDLLMLDEVRGTDLLFSSPFLLFFFFSPLSFFSFPLSSSLFLLPFLFLFFFFFFSPLFLLFFFFFLFFPLVFFSQPTNHLDLEAVLWLQSYLQTYQHTVLLVSHDRSFLNEVCTDVMLFKNLRLTYFRGTCVNPILFGNSFGLNHPFHVTDKCDYENLLLFLQ